MKWSDYNYQGILIAMLFSMILKIGQYGSFIIFPDLAICSGMFFFSAKEKRMSQYYTIYICAVYGIETVVKGFGLLN